SQDPQPCWAQRRSGRTELTTAAGVRAGETAHALITLRRLCAIRVRVAAIRTRRVSAHAGAAVNRCPRRATGAGRLTGRGEQQHAGARAGRRRALFPCGITTAGALRSEEHTSELQSRENLVCRLLLEKKKKENIMHRHGTKKL